MQGLTLEALRRLGWSKTRLMNEAFRLGIPLVLADQARRFGKVTDLPLACQSGMNGKDPLR